MAGSVYWPTNDASSVIWPLPQWNSKGRGTGRPLAAAVLGMPHLPTAPGRGSTAALSRLFSAARTGGNTGRGVGESGDASVFLANLLRACGRGVDTRRCDRRGFRCGPDRRAAGRRGGVLAVVDRRQPGLVALSAGDRAGGSR